MISHHFFIRWYGIGILLMIIMVAVGGITRLTHSGLSIVEWKPITGVLPPLNDSDWSEEFEKYKKSPEFEKNKHFEKFVTPLANAGSALGGGGVAAAN